MTNFWRDAALIVIQVVLLGTGFLGWPLYRLLPRQNEKTKARLRTIFAIHLLGMMVTWGFVFFASRHYEDWLHAITFVYLVAVPTAASVFLIWVLDDRRG